MYDLLGRLIYFGLKPLFRRYFRGSNRVRVVLVLKNQEVLLIKNWLGCQTWNLPGGGIKKNENAKEAGIRELFEETGIAVSIDQILDQKVINYFDKNLKIDRSFILLRVDLASRPKINRARFEIIDAKWVKLSDIPSDLCQMVDQVLSTKH